MRSLLSRPPLATALAFATALVLAPLAAAPAFASSEPVTLPPPALDATATDGIQTAVFAGGCFWGVQAVFQHIKGVVNAVSGYAGGDEGDRGVRGVSTGRRAMPRRCEITFDP